MQPSIKLRQRLLVRQEAGRFVLGIGLEAIAFLLGLYEFQGADIDRWTARRTALLVFWQVLSEALCRGWWGKQLAAGGTPAAQRGWSALRRLAGLLAVSCGALHAVLVVFGAFVVDKALRTLLCAITITALTTLPALLHSGADAADLRRLLHAAADQPLERCVVLRIAGALAGTWCGALPIPLDWDRPWQQWPITCVLGAAYGHLVGTGIACLYALFGKPFASKTGPSR